MKTLYKSNQAKVQLMTLYREKLESLQIEHQEIDVNTVFGSTHVIKTGNPLGKKIILFHGINAGAPLTLEAVKDLRKDYLLYAIDTVGQATMSSENRINIMDNSYGLWAEDVLKQLQIDKAYFIGISYGAYILQKLIAYKPEIITKCIFVVPSGLVNGRFWASMKWLTLPLIRFHITKKDTDLKKFLKAYIPDDDAFMFRLQKLILTGLNMDYRRPKLLQKKDVQNFNNPVYIIVADNDVFFPGHEAIARVKSMFTNYKDAYVLKNCKHMPNKDDFAVIQEKILFWLEQ